MEVKKAKDMNMNMKKEVKKAKATSMEKKGKDQKVVLAML